jgi:cytochrome oxidase Cu insertion factor (SCO1/SenC/PrrC family)
MIGSIIRIFFLAWLAGLAFALGKKSTPSNSSRFWRIFWLASTISAATMAAGFDSKYSSAGSSQVLLAAASGFVGMFVVSGILALVSWLIGRGKRPKVEVSEQSTLASRNDAFPMAIVVWVCVIIATLGIVVFYNYLIYRSRVDNAERPPVLGRLEKDLELTERNGKKVHLEELKGKVLVISWVFTRCPRGCAAVIAKLKKLHEEFASEPNLHFLSFTLDADDTPEMMKKFASGLGIADDANWWFLNGEKEAVRKFMTSQVQFRPVQDMPEKDRLSPDDKYIHDLRVAVIDHLGHVRRLEDILNADPEAQKFWDGKIRQDLRYLLNEQKKAPYLPEAAK